MLHSLTAWLGQHGRHVRRLAADVPYDDGTDPGWEAALASCLTAAGTAVQLEQLALQGYIHGTEWLAAMRSLRRCSVVNDEDDELRMSAAISGLTALEHLDLGADPIQLLPHIRLPSSITQSELSSSGDDMPPQASWAGEHMLHCSKCRQWRAE